MEKDNKTKMQVFVGTFLAVLYMFKLFEIPEFPPT